MSLSPRLELRQGQALVMTPQLLQAIKLLQLSHMDLIHYVEAELERNPLLERIDDDAPVAEGHPADGRGEERQHSDAGGAADGPEAERALAPERGEILGDHETSLENVFPDDAPAGGADSAAGADRLSVSDGLWQGVGQGGSFEADDGEFESSLSRELSLREHLEAQLDIAVADPIDRLIGRFIVDAVDDAGYLGESVESLAERVGVEPSRVAAVLRIVQSFEPTGVAARDLAECLALQLKERNRYDPCMEALLSRLDLVAKRDHASLKRLCRVDDEDLAEMLADIRSLDPKPGRAFGASPAELLVPDVFVRPAPDGSWLIDLNPQTLPRVLMNQSYANRVSRAAKTEAERSYVSECLQSAHWLTRSLDQRAKTILKVASEIVRQQDAFFAHGVAYLRPLNLKTIADAIGMHESTVSRVTSNKAIGTTRGTFEMKYFFTAAIAATAGGESHSSEAVRHRIKQLVDQESPSAILSDDAIVKKLKDEGIDIARRTVAKYRESLRIPSSIDRRREKGG